MNAVAVPYRSARALRGYAPRSSSLSGLSGSSKKRNWDAFNSTYPGTTVNSSGNYVLPSKFGAVVINQGQLDDLSGTWYGATYHPDGDQAGWQQKFDAVLKAINAYNTFYGGTPTSSPTSSLPAPQMQLPPATTGAVSIGSTLIGYATNAENAPLYAGSDGRAYFKTGAGNWVPYVGPIAGVSTPTNTLPVATNPVTTMPVPVTQPAPITSTTVPPDQTAALIAQLMAQGASQQQAYTAALQSLAAQGIQATPQIQQQVATDVAKAANPSQASTLYLAGGIVAVILIGVMATRRKKRR